MNDHDEENRIYLETLGVAVRRARLARRWSQEALALDAGCSKPVITNLESGRTSTKVGLVFRVARILDLDLGVLAATAHRRIHQQQLAA